MSCIFHLFFTIFASQFEPIHNKDYSVVKTFKAGKLAFIFYYQLFISLSYRFNKMFSPTELFCLIQKIISTNIKNIAIITYIRFYQKIWFF